MRLRIGRRRLGGQPASARGVGQGTWLALSVALLLTVTLGHTDPCRAGGLVLEAPNLTVAAGSSGSFDLLLVNTNLAGGGSFDIAADSFGLSVGGPLSITFTDVSINTIAPYIYVTSGTTQGGGPLSLDTFPNTQFTASDAEFAAAGFRTVNPGDTFGLAHVSYVVSSAAPIGTDTISFSSLTTSLSDENLNPIPFTISNGSIGIPEPSAMTEAATAVLIVIGSLRLRRRRRRAAPRQEAAIRR
jgi:hypothetical protein